jgi:hypothetical protein
MNRKTRKAMEKQQQEDVPSVTPITGEEEQKSLECLRYQQHMATIGNFQNEYVKKQQERQELLQRLISMDNSLSEVQRQVTTFAAEAKDQVRTLMTRYGFTQAQIGRLAPVPSILKQVDITSVLDMAGSPEEDAPPEPDVSVGGDNNGESPADEPADAPPPPAEESGEPVHA